MPITQAKQQFKEYLLRQCEADVDEYLDRIAPEPEPEEEEADG